MSDEHQPAPPGERTHITARVKWFNPTKGFGFIQITPEEPDVFIHVSALTRPDIPGLPNGAQGGLPDGATVECDIARAERGLQVSYVHRVDLSTAEQPSFGGGQRSAQRPPREQPTGEEHGAEGQVKFFDSNKGFGFILPDDGGRDIFLPGRVLTKTAIVRLEPGQRVRVRWREGDRGPLAVWVELA